jgi:hypothetical protein
MTILSPQDLPAYVRAVAPSYGVDPAAALAMSVHEGMVGGHGNPGDNNTSFGPWQLHIGGALPSNIGALGPVQAQQWAWSTDGINYALQDMAKKGAKGLTGLPAVASIARDFEISADIPGQTARAWSSYSGWVGNNIPIALDNFFSYITTGGQRQQQPGESAPRDGQGNVIVPVPSTANPSFPDSTTVPAPNTGAVTPQDVRLGKIGPWDIGIPNGLILGLLGLSLLLIGAILFVYGGQVRARVNTVGGSVH